LELLIESITMFFANRDQAWHPPSMLASMQPINRSSDQEISPGRARLAAKNAQVSGRWRGNPRRRQEVRLAIGSHFGHNR
jgi:hypothetical protein